MSTADVALSPSPGAARRPLTRPALGRLTLVELRKMVDTRAGFWLQLVVVALTLLVVIVFAAVGHDEDRTFTQFLNAAVQPASVLLPIVGILLVTSEWTQSTTLTTFALVPQRSRVIAAKLLAAVALAFAAFAICLVLSVIATAAAAGDAPGASHLSVGQALQVLLYLVISMVGGAAFGAALLSSAPAIVLSFVLPIAWGIVSSLVSFLDDAGRWLDPSRTYAALTDHLMSATEWARLATSVGVWVALPLAIGGWRILRSEIK
jgi:ABC-type transport system involved in multi-copper enzyme maturation permease subunit